MEVARNLLSSSPSLPHRTHFRTCFSSSSTSSSVVMLQDQAGPTVASLSTASVGRYFPTSVLIQEQREEYRPLFNMFKDDKASQVTLDRRLMANGVTVDEDKNSGNSNKLMRDLECPVHQWHGSWQLLQTFRNEENLPPSMMFPLTSTENEKFRDAETFKAISLAKRALLASKEAVSIAKDSDMIGTGVDESPLPRPKTLAEFFPEKERTVRSKRILERQSKRRKVRKLEVVASVARGSRKKEVSKKISEGFDPNDPLRLFLWGPETKQLLSSDEEFELIVQIQDNLNLERVKSKLQNQFCREPTLAEWAEAVGISSQILRSRLHSGLQSRERLINANLRMVVHVAKQYQSRGLSLQDLMQVGSIGLMKSVEKFKPHSGCRFASYAYWWIRQAIKKTIFQHSRTIRLPENVYSDLSKVMEAKRSYAGEGNYKPSTEEVARRVGIAVEKLEKLLYNTRLPYSMDQPVWADQDTTFQEITADSEIEIPSISVAKQLMREHTRNLLGTLSPRERRIISLRYGIEGGKKMPLSDIGKIYGLSKERVRQLEEKAMYKLKQCPEIQEFGEYAHLLV